GQRKRGNAAFEPQSRQRAVGTRDRRAARTRGNGIGDVAGEAVRRPDRRLRTASRWRSTWRPAGADARRGASLPDAAPVTPADLRVALQPRLPGRISHQRSQRFVESKAAVEIRLPVAFERVTQRLPAARVDAVAVRVSLILRVAGLAELAARELARRVEDDGVPQVARRGDMLPRGLGVDRRDDAAADG